LSNEENKIEREKSIEVKGVSDVIRINVKRYNYLACHYNPADLSMLNDWKAVSYQNIDILKKSFTSLRTPIECLNEKIFIRDTLLLSSAAASTLSAVGKAHGLTKIPLVKKEYENMDLLFSKNYEKFKAYAMHDALITLIHILFMNDFSFKLGALSVPNTLGTLTTKNIQNK